MNGFLLADATNTAAKQFPDVKWAITDFPRVALTDQPSNAYGLTFKSEQSGYLVGYLAAQMAKAKIGPKGKSSGKLVLSAVGGKKIPSVDNWIAGYRAGALAVDKRFKVLIDYSERFSAVRRPEVQGDRTQAHLTGRPGGVPGRRRLWPRCAAGCQAEEGLGHRRRRRPGLPRPAHHDERREAGGPRPSSRSSSSRRKASSVRAGTSSSTLKNKGQDVGKISKRVPPALIAKMNAQKPLIIKGKIKPPSTL